VNAAAVWSYVTRLLTSLQSPDHLQKYLGGPSGALGTVLPANKSLYDLIALDRLDNGTFGLAALKLLIDAVEGKLDNGVFGLAALDSDLNTLLTRLTALRAGYLDYINNSQLLNVPNIKIMEHEIEFPSAEALDDINAIVYTATTERTITVASPTGATIRRALLLAVITIMNNSANAQKIDIQVQGRKGAGAWTTYFDQTDCVGFPAVDGATTSLVALQDVTALVDTAGAYGFQCQVRNSVAQSVRYTTEYLLVVTYRMS